MDFSSFTVVLPPEASDKVVNLIENGHQDLKARHSVGRDSLYNCFNKDLLPSFREKPVFPPSQFFCNYISQITKLNPLAPDRESRKPQV